jgi:hypothetical protein
MPIPIDPLVADRVAVLDENLREDFEERAGIIEFDAGIPRAHAECLALLDVLRRNPAVLTGVITLRMEVNRMPLWVLTTDLDYGRKSGGVELSV